MWIEHLKVTGYSADLREYSIKAYRIGGKAHHISRICCEFFFIAGGQAKAKPANHYPCEKTERKIPVQQDDRD